MAAPKKHRAPARTHTTRRINGPAPTAAQIVRAQTYANVIAGARPKPRRKMSGVSGKRIFGPLAEIALSAVGQFVANKAMQSGVKPMVIAGAGAAGSMLLKNNMARNFSVNVAGAGVVAMVQRTPTMKGVQDVIDYIMPASAPTYMVDYQQTSVSGPADFGSEAVAPAPMSTFDQMIADYTKPY